MRYFILFLFLLFSRYESIAQKHRSPVFNSYNSIGFIAGKSPVAFTVQTINGFSFNKWFLGAGFGIDDYFIKTLPLFIDVKKAFDFKKCHLFLYADVGSHFIAKDRKQDFEFYRINTEGKLYIDAGIGAKIKITPKSHLFFSLGNTLKNIAKTQTSEDVGFPYKDETAYRLSRISLRLGCQF